MNDNQFEAGDLLMGAAAIAKALGITRRQTYRLVYDDILPTFKLGATVSARRSTLTEWLAKQDSRAAA